MTHSLNTSTLFHQQLGKIFYAVAAVDKSIRKEEISALKKIIREQWVSTNQTTDEFNTNTAYQIEIIFDWLDENNWNIKHAIPDLLDFKKEHESYFSDEIKALIIKTAHAIADAFSNKNKSELMYIQSLELALYHNR
jgi:hypothetical protein